MQNILLVEDDKLLNNALCYALESNGYNVFSSQNIKTANDYIMKEKFDLIILDINLPDGNGFDLCKKIKSRYDTPIIFLTANDMESDFIKGYELGADDYITKPFSMSIFQKKVSVILRRTEKKETLNDVYSDGILLIDFRELKTTLNDEPLLLTPLEYRMLKILSNNPKIVLTRQILLEKLWDIDENFVDDHALTSNISRIRNKIEIGKSKYIKTIYGMGYMWVGAENEN